MGRRLSVKEMGIIRRDEAITNSMIKRGLITPRKTARQFHVICGCGAEGCVGIFTLSKEDLQYNNYF